MDQKATEDGPQLQYVESAFLRDRDPKPERPLSGFEDYFSVESLFEAGEDSGEPQKDAWEVLGVSHDATWDEIVRVHRTLAKSLHPDRFSGADDEQLRWAEESIRAINVAFRELRDIYRSTPA